MSESDTSSLLRNSSLASESRATELGLALLPVNEPILFETSELSTAQLNLTKKLREAAGSSLLLKTDSASKASGLTGADLGALLCNSSTFEATAKLICWEGITGQLLGELSISNNFHLVGPSILIDYLNSRKQQTDVVHDLRFLLSLQLADRTMGFRAKAETVTPKPALDRILLRIAAELIPLLTEQIDFVLPFDSQTFFAEFAPPFVPNKTSTPARHFGVACNGCLVEPIVGERRTCVVCSSLNLCQTCFETKPLLPYGARIHDSHKHEMRRHETPLPRKELPLWFMSLWCIIQEIRKGLSKAFELLATLPGLNAPIESKDELKAPIKREEIEALLHFARSGRFIATVKDCLHIFIDFATNPAQFDCVFWSRTGAATSCVGLLQILASDALFVNSLTADKATVRFFLQTLCQPASMRDTDISLAMSGLRVLVDIVTVDGQAEHLVKESEALLWLSPLIHHPWPTVALRASLVIGLILHQLSDNTGSVEIMEIQKRAFFATRSFGPEYGGLSNLSARGIRLLADMITSRDGSSSLAVIGLSALVQLVSVAVAGADWPILQQLGPSFFKTLASFASSLSMPLKAQWALKVLIALGHTLPPLSVPSTIIARERQKRANDLSSIGLGALRRPANLWDADDVTLWASVQPFREHAPLFRAAWLNGRVLLSLDNNDLVAMGIERPVHRKAVLVAIDRLRSATERALARRSATSNTDGLMSPQSHVHSEDEGGLDFHAIGIKRGAGASQGAGAVGNVSADIFLCTPCEGCVGLATIIASQLRGLGIFSRGHDTAQTEHANFGMLVRGNVDIGAIGYKEETSNVNGKTIVTTTESDTDVLSPSFYGVDVTQVAAEVQSSAAVLVLLARRTLVLSSVVGTTASMLPSCLPARLHARLRAEIGAALRTGRPIIAVAQSGFEWPTDASMLIPEFWELRDAIDPLVPGLSANTKTTVPISSPIPMSANEQNIIESLELPQPTARGGILLRLNANELVVPDGRLARAIAAFVMRQAS
jgi:hypothetical protein